jgi:hypothetical protein
MIMKPIHFAYPAVLLLLIAVVVCVWCSLWPHVPVLSSQFHDTAIADAKLTDAQLIKEYKAAGLSLKGVDQRELTDGDRSEAFYLPNERLAAAQSEILQRGSQIVPSLISFLEQEAPKEREKDPATGLVLSFTRDVLRLLAQIGDARAAPITLRILEGWDGKANSAKQAAALSALENITHFCFHKVRPLCGNFNNSLEHPDALDIEDFTEYATPVRLYREWMQGEGKEPSQWGTIARKRARQLLASEDLDQVYCAATFLRPSAGRDDNPDATLARVAEIAWNMNIGIKYYEVSGKPTFGWTKMVAAYGPRARPYATKMLRIQKEAGMNNCSGYAELRKIGGREILTFLFEALPKVSAEANSALEGSDAHKGFTSSDPRGWWIDSQREVRFGIDRWAGRLFDSDADREAWWNANKTKSPQEWLTANLDVLNAQVARRELWVMGMAHEILPDLPGCTENELPEVGRRRVEGPFRVEWLDEHRKELCYDADAGCFRLAHKG